MGPVAQADGYDTPELIDEFVPSGAAAAEKLLVAWKDAIRAGHSWLRYPV